MPFVLSLGSWKFWLISIIIIFFILWLFLGNKENKKITPNYPSDLLPPGGICINNENATYSKPIPHQIPLASNKPLIRQGRSISENMAAEVFSNLIELYGGNINNIQYNVRLPEIINPETNRKLELDCYYDDGIKKISLEYQGSQHYNYPNHYHKNTPKGREEFDAQLRRDKYKLDACEKNNICLIRVPYTVDTCDVDNNHPSGYMYNPKLKKEEKRLRLLNFIKDRLNYCLGL